MRLLPGCDEQRKERYSAESSVVERMIERDADMLIVRARRRVTRGWTWSWTWWCRGHRQSIQMMIAMVELRRGILGSGDGCGTTGGSCRSR